MRPALERHAAKMRLANAAKLPLRIRRMLHSQDFDVRTRGRIEKDKFFEQLFQDKLLAEGRAHFRYSGGGGDR
jgi:hypothetical protein